MKDKNIVLQFKHCIKLEFLFKEQMDHFMKALSRNSS